MIKTSSCWRFAAAVSPLALVIAGSPAMAADTNPAVTGEETTAAAADQPARHGRPDRGTTPQGNNDRHHRLPRLAAQLDREEEERRNRG